MEEKKDINALIGELVSYGMENSLVEPADEVYVTNQLLSLFGLAIVSMAIMQDDLNQMELPPHLY